MYLAEANRVRNTYNDTYNISSPSTDVLIGSWGSKLLCVTAWVPINADQLFQPAADKLSHHGCSSAAKQTFRVARSFLSFHM